MKRFLTFAFVSFSYLTLVRPVYALDLREYIAGPDFVSHVLSTGEQVHFSGEGGGSGAVRQYKNSNYEQFFVRGSGIYRREDTSWAPLPGFQDAICENGNKAIYALVPDSCKSYSTGEEVHSTGAYWAPAYAEVGATWETGAHQIVPIDSTAKSGEYSYSLPPLRYCPISEGSAAAMGGVNYAQTCITEGHQLVLFEAHYGPGEYRFCTGITNPADMIVLKGMSGPGAGDTFFFMKGWGLVGFIAGGFEAGLLEGPGVSGGTTGSCTSPTGATLEELPRQIMGHITSSKTGKVPGLGKLIEVTGESVKGATICAYQGTRYFEGMVSNNGAVGSTIGSFSGSAITDEYGDYVLDTAWVFGGGARSYQDIETPPSNFLAFYCGTELKDIYRMDVRNTLAKILGTFNNVIPQKYHKLFKRITGEELDLTTLMPPLDVTIYCDPDTTPGVFDEPAQNLKTGEMHPECPAEVAYVDRTDRSRGSCAPGGDHDLGVPHHPNQIFPTLDLDFTDERQQGALPPFVPQETLAPPPEGRTDNLGFGWSYTGMVAHATRFVAGGFLEGFFSAPMSQGTPPPLPNCDLLKEANSPIAKLVGSGMNALKAWGFAPLLESPSSFLRDAPGFDTFNPSKAAARYALSNLGIPVCQSDVYGKVTLAQIQPPRSWVGTESYCNPGGTLPDGEPCPYLLDVSHFRYDLIYYAVIGGHSVIFQNETLNDSYDSPERRTYCYAAPCPWDGTPDIGAEEDPYQDGKGGITETHVMLPCDEQGQYCKSAATSVVSDNIGPSKPPGKAMYPPGVMVGMPPGQEKLSYTNTTEKTDLVTGEVLKYSLAGLNYLVNARNTYARVGLPGNACMFSVLDGHHIWPLNRMMGADKHHPTTTFYDFMLEPFEEVGLFSGGMLYDPGTLYDKNHSGVFNKLLTFLTSFFNINGFNWISDEGEVAGSCIKESHPRCDCAGPCASCGCEQKCNDDDPPECWCESTEHKYKCDGDVPAIELQNRSAYHFSDKNMEGLDGVVHSILPIAKMLPRFDMGTLCYADGYATNSSQAGGGEGYFTECGKDQSWGTDMARKAVSSPLGKYSGMKAL